MLPSGSSEKRLRCSGWVRVHLWVFNEQQQLEGNETEKSSEEPTNQKGSFNLGKHSYPIQFNFIYMASVTRALLGAWPKPRARPLNKNCLWRKGRPLGASHRQHIYWFTLFMHPAFHDLFQHYNALFYDTFTAPDIWLSPKKNYANKTSVLACIWAAIFRNFTPHAGIFLSHLWV